MASRPIDEKIVAMKMDNSDFKRKAIETTSLFGKLRDSLNKIPGVNLNKVTQEFGNIQRAAGRVTMDTLANSVNEVTKRFSNLDVVATTALVNIANRAVNAGLEMIKSLTSAQVMDGFREYEMKMGSIGTMLANTEWAGSTLDDVKKTLGELNDYADKTIYSFAEMTSNIGRFTAAGVTLEDSAIAIKGLGNLAAISGSNTEQLNTAMYQMSQALAAGKLNLMDWNSMVNAGMAGKKTQDALVATAKAMGKNVDLSDGFRNSIQDGWLTSEVFLETLKKFGQDESMTKAATSVRTFTGMIAALKEGIGSGWAESWEIIFGDFEEATKLWTGLSNVIGGFFKKQTDARNALLRGIFEGGGFTNIFKGLSNAAKPIVQIFDAIGAGFKKAFPPKSVDSIVKTTEGFKNLTSGMEMSKGTIAKLTTIFQGIFAVFSTGWEIVKALADVLLDLIPSFSGVADGILDLLVHLAEMSIAFNETIKQGDALEVMGNVIKKVFGAVATVLEAVIDVVVAFAGGVSNGFQAIMKHLQSIGQYVSPVIGMFETFFSSIGDGFNWLMDKLAPVGQFFKDLFGFIGDNKGTIIGGGFLAGLVAIGVKIWQVFDAFTSPFEHFSDTLEGISDTVNAFALSIHATSLVTVAIALGILAASLKLLESLETEDIVQGLSALTISLGAMIGGLKLIDHFDIAGSMTTTANIIALAAAVTIMSIALKNIADLDTDELIRGVTGLVAIMGTMAGAVAIMSKFGGGATIGASSLQLIALAGSIHILLSAVEKISKISVASLTKGVTTIGIIMAEMALFLKVASKNELSFATTLGILALAKGLGGIVDAIEQVSKIDTKELITGLITIGAVLTEISLFAKVVANKNLLNAGVGVLAIAVAMNALVIPIEVLGRTPLSVLAKGIGAIGVALVAIGAASKLLQGTVTGAVGIGLMAASLTLLLVPIKGFAAMTLGDIAKGIGSVAAAIVVIGGASLLLAPAAAPMIAFSGALALIGAAMLAAGAGMALFGTGLVTLATLSAASVLEITATLGLLLVGFSKLIPAAADFVLNLGIHLVEGIAKLIPKLVKIVFELITKLLETIADNAPKFIDAGVKMITNILDGLSKNMPKMMKSATTLITTFLDGIADNLPKIVSSANNLMLTFIETLTENIRKNGPRFVKAISELLGEIILLFIQAGIEVINALFGWMPGVKEATAEIGKNAERYIRENFGASDAGKDKGDEFTKGLNSKNNSSKAAGKSLANAGKTGLTSVSATSAGANFGAGFAGGISSKIESVKGAARALASAAANRLSRYLDIRSPSRLLFKDGGFFGEGFALGIKDKINRVGTVSKNLAEKARNTVNNIVEGFEMAPEDNELHFKAVVDYDTIDTNRFGRIAPMSIIPDTSFANGMVSATKVNMGQNGNNNNGPIDNSVSNHEYVYNVNVTANGVTSRSEVVRLAQQIREELKNQDDRERISKGLGVSF